MKRQPIVAGMFYSGTREGILAELEGCLDPPNPEVELPEAIRAGIVPHAGWRFSGTTAGYVFRAIAEKEAPETFILFGAAHSVGGAGGFLYEKGAWISPLGEVGIDEELAEELAEKPSITPSTRAHDNEHSIEVQIPFIQHLFPEAKIVPILVPPSPAAATVGRETAEAIRACGRKIVCIASTDLTHYGPRYGLVSHGVGSQGVDWAHNVNDRMLLKLIDQLADDEIVTHCSLHRNACGAGAVAAAIAAAKGLGTHQAVLLEHTNSAEIMRSQFGQTDDNSVGYAAVVLG